MTWSTVIRLLCVPTLFLTMSGSAFAQADQHADHDRPPVLTTPLPTQPAAGTHHHDDADAKELPSFIPRLTDEDRIAAFPDVEGHAVHGEATSSFVLFDQLEWHAGRGTGGLNVDGHGWVGRDRDRLWVRGEADSAETDDAHMHLLYGRQLWRWWDLVGGVRQDFHPGLTAPWAAIGVQGLAPYWFEIEATAYLGTGGRTQARFEVKYELLLTNRLVLQPLLEAAIFGKPDPERGIGAGASTTDVGLRLRYERRREFAPYAGVNWHRKYRATADFAKARGEDTSGVRIVAGTRLWF